MTENEKYLKEAQEKIKAFETEMEPERLLESSAALENVILAKEDDVEIRRKRRAESLSLWLALLQILDKHLDPNFDPEDLPENVVQPPPLSDGTVLRPGTDLAKISNPQDRAAYEKAIANNRKKAKNYSLQTQLRRLNERIPPRAEAFIRESYTAGLNDRDELKTAIDKFIENPGRKAELSKLLTPPTP